MLPTPKDKPKKKNWRHTRVPGRKRGRVPIDRKLDPEHVIEVIHRERGILIEIASELGISRRVAREYIGKHTSTAAALKEAREAMGDVAERKLYELIEAGDVRCITYYLSTVHKNRGYGIRKDESIDPFAETKMHVQTINVLAIPPGQYLTSAEAATLARASLPPPIEGAVMSNGKNGNGNGDDEPEDADQDSDPKPAPVEPGPAPVEEPKDEIPPAAAEEDAAAGLSCLM